MLAFLSTEGNFGTAVVAVLFCVCLAVAVPFLMTVVAILRVNMWTRVFRREGAKRAEVMDVLKRAAHSDIQRRNSFFLRKSLK